MGCASNWGLVASRVIETGCDATILVQFFLVGVGDSGRFSVGVAR